MHTEFNTNNVGGEYASIYTKYRGIQNAIRDNSILTIGRGKENFLNSAFLSLPKKKTAFPFPFPILKRKKKNKASKFDNITNTQNPIKKSSRPKNFLKIKKGRCLQSNALLDRGAKNPFW